MRIQNPLLIVSFVLLTASVQAMYPPLVDIKNYVVSDQVLVRPKETSGPSVFSTVGALSEELSLQIQSVQPSILGWTLVKLAPSEEAEVSIQSNTNLVQALQDEGYETAPVLLAIPANEIELLSKENEYSKQKWHYDAINLSKAWEIMPVDKKTVNVAVLDTGVKKDHPDFKDQLLPGRRFVSPDRSVDFNDPEGGHGTHVAGTIAAALNGAGAVGIAPWAKILPVQVLDPVKKTGTSIDIVEAMLWVSGLYSIPGVGLVPPEHMAHVINLSLGGQAACPTYFKEAIQKILKKGIAIFIAAGNNSVPVKEFYPANCGGAATVAAINPRGGLAKYSNFGDEQQAITIAAPGGEIGLFNKAGGIWSTFGSSYGALQGTSMATPHVAGVAALVVSLNKKLSPAELTKILVSTASPLACDKKKCGAGLLNAAAAVNAVTKGEPVSLSNHHE